MKQQQGKENLIIKANIPVVGSDLTIKTDPARLKQVLTNLIGNALKFTESGSIEFGYAVVKNKIIIKVSDTGIGISKDKLDIIFDRFQQLEHKDNAKYDGTGLGLAISKGIIDLLNGTISVESEQGNGSIFTITIPYVPDRAQNATCKRNKQIDKQVFQNKKLLVAEDDYINKLYIEEILKEIPIDVIWAENGEDAVKLFRESDGISLVLMDIQMPQLDGYKAAKQIFEHNPDTKIIAQTAYAMSSDREKCLKNGFVDYISKPIQKDRLIELLGRWID